MLAPFNLHQWINENKHLLKPPINNKLIYEDAEFIIMAVGGPNARKDYHYNESEEFFYQIQGDIQVKLQIDGKPKVYDIKEGEIFLLPPRIPHNPIRFENTIGLVIERKCRDHEINKLMWFCENCNNPLHEESFQMINISKQFHEVFTKFYSSDELNTCKKCSTKMIKP